MSSGISGANSLSNQLNKIELVAELISSSNVPKSGQSGGSEASTSSPDSGVGNLLNVEK